MLEYSAGDVTAPKNPTTMNLWKTAMSAVLLLLVGTASAHAGQYEGADDPYLPSQWGLELIRAPEAWEIATGKGTLIAIVDTGIDMDHPDLVKKLARGGRDFHRAGAPQDERGHGTHVAGIAAASTDNGIGVAGVAPRARLLALRACDSSCDGEAVTEAIRYAADRGAEVINLSLGIHPLLAPVAASQLHDDAIDYAWDRGAVVVAASGNNSMPLCSHPADVARVICVGSVDRFSVRTHSSNGDATMRQAFVMAPGGRQTVAICSEMILSTVVDPDDELVDPCKVEAGYEYSAGTSMAAPFVSGVAALLASQGLSNDEIVERILSTAKDLGAPGRDPVYGHGLVDALAAVSE